MSHAQRLARGAGALQRLLHPVVPRPAIGQARQLVVARRRLQLRKHALPLALEAQPQLGLEPHDDTHAEEGDRAGAVADDIERHVLDHGPADGAEHRAGGRDQPAAQPALGREQADRDHVEEANGLDRVRHREPQQRDEDEQQRAHDVVGALGPRGAQDINHQPCFRRAAQEP